MTPWIRGSRRSNNKMNKYALVAQRIRASDFGSEGRGFESLRAHIMAENFKRVIEDFKCENCGTEVKGNGFTNHCPKCLYSKHVDFNPGDREMLEECGALMEPVDVIIKNDSYQIKHLCTKCGHVSYTRTQDGDDVSSLIEKLKDTKHFDMPTNK